MKDLITDGAIIADVLSASGIRAIRYSKEIENIKVIVINLS